MRSIAALFARLSVVIALLVAMAGTGFAHKFAQPLDPALLAFVQAGGSLDDLCSHDDVTHHHANQTCDACHLVGAAVVPDTSLNRAAPFGEPTRSALFEISIAPRLTSTDPSRPARAPPVV